MLGRLRQFFQNHDTRPFIIKTCFYIVLLGVTFYGAFGMTRSFVKVRSNKISKEKELVQINQRIENMKNESIKDDDFQKEKIVREKLHMTRPGEDLIIIVPKEEEFKP